MRHAELRLRPGRDPVRPGRCGSARWGGYSLPGGSTCSFLFCPGPPRGGCGGQVMDASLAGYKPGQTWQTRLSAPVPEDGVHKGESRDRGRVGAHDARARARAARRTISPAGPARSASANPPSGPIRTASGPGSCTARAPRSDRAWALLVTEYRCGAPAPSPTAPPPACAARPPRGCAGCRTARPPRWRWRACARG